MAELAIAAVGLTFSVSQTIFAALQCSELKALFGSDIESLDSSVKTLQAVLLDADDKQANGFKLSAQEQVFIAKINDALYDAEDWLDAYAARAKLKKMSREGRNKFITDVSELASRFISLAIDSPDLEVKKTTERLEKIGRDAQNYKFDSLPMKRKREETCSVVDENHIVGREDDQRRIVDMLTHPIVQGELPVLAIVGIGGLGKTTLARLVYKDPKIQNEFSLRLWVCVSDQGGKQFNLRAILAGIYMSATREKSIGDMGLDQLVQDLRSKLDQNKYLLVLDDLWSENEDECRELVHILIGSVQRGSRIVVTTRSIGTAEAIGSSRSYELHRLSEDNSWLLFEMKVEREIREGHDLFEIGKDIVKKCVNVPLAINVVGSLLRGKPKDKWQSFQKSRLLENKKDDGIMWILKFSYYHLSPSLKSCFTYCALFPKDFKIEKEGLISMWMAHGYVKDEDVAEYHFEILVQRCFFQEIKENVRGNIEFKIHDLIHDMAQEIAGKEICIANSATTQLDKKIRHLYDDALASRTEGFVTLAKIRSYVHCFSVYDEMSSNRSIKFLSTVLANWRQLRVLDLGVFGIRKLPYAICELLHLRHLDLHGNEKLRMLPKAITKLVHLQFLNLDGCDKLKEFPRDFKKLVSLRTLYVPINSLEYMPSGMGNMTSLTKLNKFIVGNRESCVKQEDKLEDLRVPRNLNGSLEIRIKGGYKDAKEYCGEGGYICNTQHLNSISIRWGFERHEEWRVGNDEDILEDLQPHRNLEELHIISYLGERIPRWTRKDSLTISLPNLVKIKLSGCNGLEELPWLGRLQHLKTLKLKMLGNVEYMENRRSIGSSRDDGDVASNSSNVVESSSMLLFPSLEDLELNDMPKLKGWWRGSSDCTSGEDEIVNNDNNICMLTTLPPPLPSFPRLTQLSIMDCQNLTSIPLCPAVETLVLSGNVNKKIVVLMIEEDKKRVGSSSGNVVEISSNQKTLPMVSFQRLVKMTINGDDEVESLSEYEEVFRSCSSSLRSLILVDCCKLRSVSEGGGLEYLTALEKLHLSSLRELEFEEREENEEEMPWRSLAQSLRSLNLSFLEKVDSLPKGMRYLTSLTSLEIGTLRLLKEIPEWIECLSSLQSLKIKDCKHLETLPREMKNLTSLKQLELTECSEELKRRCEKPDGEYCPILEHIPHFRFR